MKRYLLPAAVAAIVTAGCATLDQGLMTATESVSSRDPVTGVRQVNLTSEEQEIQKGQQATMKLLAAARANNIAVDSEPNYSRIKAIFDRLLVVSHRKHLPWEIHLIDVDAWNAMTPGGGQVYVLSGILEHPQLRLRTNDEIAAVLAHEIAHVSARHVSEAQGKLAIAQIASKNTDSSFYEAAFTTNQEDEADRISTLYLALAGYDPRAASPIWARMHRHMGSSPGQFLYDHPLNADRANNLAAYSSRAISYYSPGKINPNHEALLKDNAVYAYAEESTVPAGEGGGFMAALEAAAAAYGEFREANQEAQRREGQAEQQTLAYAKLAATRLSFSELKVSRTQAGGYGLFGTAANLTGYRITDAIVRIEYFRDGQRVSYQDMRWEQLVGFQRKSFGLPLDTNISYTNVRLVPVRVELGN